MPVSGPLPCEAGRTWTFAAKPTPTVDFEVACNSYPAPQFSVQALACDTVAVNATASVAAAANICPQPPLNIMLDPYTGEHDYSHDYSYDYCHNYCHNYSQTCLVCDIRCACQYSLLSLY